MARQNQELETMIRPAENQEHFILGSKITAISAEQLQNRILEIVQDDRRELILNANVFGLNLAYEQPWLREFRNRAHIVYCDGAGVVLGGRLLGHKLPVRITMADWIWQLAAFCRQENLSLFFLGGAPGRADASARILKERYPGLNIVGTHHGYFSKEGAECDRIVAAINDLRPNLLIVGFGMPLQEKWLMQNHSRIYANTCFAQGAIFDFVSGAARRCPAWMGTMGLEWLFRFCLEPRRMFSRYIIGNPLFICRVIKERLLGAMKPDRASESLVAPETHSDT